MDSVRRGVVGLLEFQTAAEEIFSVQVLPGLCSMNLATLCLAVDVA